MNRRLIKTGAIELSTESFGSETDPAILLVAGATVSMLYWDASFCKRLADQGFFVIRYDHRDTGKSTTYPADTTPYDIVDLTDDAIAVLEHYQLREAHLVGMSLGGLISQIAALKYPRHVLSLTLFATGPWGDSDPTIPEMDQRIIDFQSKSKEVDWTDEKQVVAYMVEGAALMSGRKPFEKKRNERLVQDEFRRARNYVSMFNHAAIQGGEEYYNRLDEIHLPTLIIHGTDDRVWHYRTAGVLRSKIKGASLISLEGTGHELHSEDWDTLIHGITMLAEGQIK